MQPVQQVYHENEVFILR